jgi:hypothetical protein
MLAEANSWRNMKNESVGTVAGWCLRGPSLLKMVLAKPATADRSEIGSLGTRVRPSDRLGDHPEDRNPQKNP